MVNILIPMAGRGSRFAEKGFAEPKPLIPVKGTPMIKLVINNIRPKCPHKFIFIVLKEHLQKFKLEKNLKDWGGSNSEIIELDEVTAGAACTALTAKNHINNETALLIANSDQYVKFDPNDFITSLSAEKLDGLILTMRATGSKWSYARTDETGFVKEVAEKKVISEFATVGLYIFKSGSLFVSAAENMIKKNIRTNNEFYIAPVYNELIEEGKRVKIYNIGDLNKNMFGLGTPEDLENFLNLTHNA